MDLRTDDLLLASDPCWSHVLQPTPRSILELGASQLQWGGKLWVQMNAPSFPFFGNKLDIISGGQGTFSLFCVLLLPSGITTQSATSQVSLGSV